MFFCTLKIWADACILSIFQCYNCYRASGCTAYLLINSILKIMVHLQMLYSQIEDQQVAPQIKEKYIHTYIHTYITIILAPNILLCFSKGLFTFIVLIGTAFVPTRQIQIHKCRAILSNLKIENCAYCSNHLKHCHIFTSVCYSIVIKR